MEWLLGDPELYLSAGLISVLGVSESRMVSGCMIFYLYCHNLQYFSLLFVNSNILGDLGQYSRYQIGLNFVISICSATIFKEKLNLILKSVTQ